MNTGWIQTHSGKQFFPGNPTPASIDIHDIAMSLSKQCRFAGHCMRFYSVAEHCVLMAQVAEPKHKLTALMHDASEAYLVDIPRPIKPMLTGYAALEDDIMQAIANKYKFSWPLPAKVKELDLGMLIDERKQNMAQMQDKVSDDAWGASGEGLGVRLQYWSPTDAFYQFLQAFLDYGGRP